MRKFTLLLILFVVACAPKTKPQYPKRPPGAVPPPVTGTTEEQKESPERTASNALVDEGKVALNRGLYDHSADLFQQAVTIDPTNGAGYFYLAFAKVRGGEYGEAAGLLEKAKLLLGSNPLWTDKLQELRTELDQKQPK